jgi:Tfp pilus assembly protein PilV
MDTKKKRRVLHSREQKTRNEAGFTLIELVISLVVMMVAGLAVASLFFYSIQNNVGGSERAVAMALAQQQMEQLRSVRFDDATLAAGAATFSSVSGGRTYQIVRTISEETNSDGTPKNLKKITISVMPQAAGGNWIRTPVILVAMRSSTARGPYFVQ